MPPVFADAEAVVLVCDVVVHLPTPEELLRVDEEHVHHERKGNRDETKHGKVDQLGDLNPVVGCNTRLLVEDEHDDRNERRLEERTLTSYA